MEKQNTDPSIVYKRSRARSPEKTRIRAKTPTPQVIKSEAVLPKKVVTKPICSSTSSQASDNRKNNANKEHSSNETLRKDVADHIYSQVCLLSRFRQSVAQQNESKCIQEIESVEMELMDAEDEVAALTMNTEKIRVLKQEKGNLSNKIKEVNDTISMYMVLFVYVTVTVNKLFYTFTLNLLQKALTWKNWKTPSKLSKRI